MSNDATPQPDSALSSWDALRRPIWMFDPHALRGIYANQAALRLWGAQSLSELLSRDFSRLSPAVLARTARLAQATADGAEVDERWTFYPRGEPVTVQATISTYRLTDGRPVLLFEAAPTEVEAGERRAVEALRHTSTLITLFDQEGRAIFANPAAFSAYGGVEHRFEARFAEQGRGPKMLAQALAGETIAEVCETITTSGRRWHHLDARPVLDPVTGAAGVILNERDVTLRVEAEQARAAAEQKAAMAEARQRFLTDMSHELRTPLNAVIGFSDLLAIGGLSQEQLAQAERINDAGKHLLRVVNEMIRFSELRDSKGSASSETVSGPSAPQSNPSPAHVSPEGPLRVLYIDDNESNRALVVAILTSQGICCETADDGAQGVEAARTGDWDVILMDIQMPVMTGVEATRAIRAMPTPVAASVPIIAVTANTLADQTAEYAQAGMDDLIAKPIDMAELITKVSTWAAEDRRGSATPDIQAPAGLRRKA